MKYFAAINGASWAHGPVGHFDTIKQARKWAESFGDTADECAIFRVLAKRMRLVAVYKRDSNGNGQRWFRATFQDVCTWRIWLSL